MSGSLLITGGSGFLSHAIVKRLLETQEYDRICIYSRSEHRQAEMRSKFNHDPRLRFMIGDVRDSDRLELALHGVETVIAAAALKRVEACAYDPQEAILTNVMGTSNTVKACLRGKVKKLVLVSSDKAVAPTTLYGATKQCAEQLVLAARSYARTKTAVVRYGNVWGSTGSVVPAWMAHPEKATITDPDATRFFMRVDEAVALVMQAVQYMPHDVLTPELPAYRLGDLADAVFNYKPLHATGLRPGEKMHERMTDDGPDSSQVRRLSVGELREALSAH